MQHRYSPARACSLRCDYYTVPLAPLSTPIHTLRLREWTATRSRGRSRFSSLRDLLTVDYRFDEIGRVETDCGSGAEVL
jgi:hypothetical protein